MALPTRQQGRQKNEASARVTCSDMCTAGASSCISLSQLPWQTTHRAIGAIGVGWSGRWGCLYHAFLRAPAACLHQLQLCEDVSDLKTVFRGKLDLHIGTGRRSPGPYASLEKQAQSFVPVIFPHTKFRGGTWYWYANFSSLVSVKS